MVVLPAPEGPVKTWARPLWIMLEACRRKPPSADNSSDWTIRSTESVEYGFSV